MVNEPAKLLPLRFIDTSNTDSSFDGNFSNEQIPQWKMGQKCYLQKFQRNDKLRLQWISDAPLLNLKILNEDGLQVDEIEWQPSLLTLIGFPEATIYEIDFPFSSLQEGVYIFQQDEWEAEAIELKDEHENTILIEYSASENDYDVVFDTDIVFQFRVEGGIGNYAPKNQREVYVNQIYNPAQLRSVAHRQFTLYIGFQSGVPEWVLDKANIITQCDEVFYDGVQYQPINESEFEVIRADDVTAFVGASIDIEPTNNFIKFETGNNPQQQTIKYVRRSHSIQSVAGNQSVIGIFRNASKLQEIVIYKSGADYTLKVGITPNGNEISEFLVDENTGYTQLVEWAFNAATTVYLSGAGLNADSIYFLYDQMDAPEIPINTNPQEKVFKGATMIWNGTPEERDELWDLTTGLGKPNTKALGWCIAGTNGTQNYNNAYPVGIDVSETGQDYNTLGNEVGANTKPIPKAALPADGVHLFNDSARSGNDENPGPNGYAARVLQNYGQFNTIITKAPGTGYPNIIKSANLGNGENFNVQPKSIVSLYVVKIVD